MSDQHRSSGSTDGDLKQLLRALLVAGVSVGMLLGSFLLSQLEAPDEAQSSSRQITSEPTITPFLPTFTPQPSPTPVATEGEPTRTPTEEPEPTRTPTGEAEASPTPEPTSSPTPAPTRTPAPTPLPTVCGAPSDWVSYTVQRGDTLFSIAGRYNVDMGTIQRANCLPSYAIDAGDTLYVPTEVSVSLPKEYPAPALLTPEDGANFPAGERVVLRWAWEGELSEHEHFDVRVWKEGAPNYGIGWSKEEHYAVKRDPGVTYYWSVAVIYGKDGKMEEQLSPQSPPRKLFWGHLE